ncbi:ABC transporter substrate-binding protein [Clostridium sp. chh4-2]|uniref:ABC transporter substrate-binding protein n=1 Tax=Clostridium sp. chh4-2 TaxID=2067550 RepID=UPI000CCE51A3|nr:extracellular solute-binding protein [Clostridium sp. chh4-2]PNV63412.1 ABC transporter substrate-binding protein [Clostridium sp. chh4-2]
MRKRLLALVMAGVMAVSAGCSGGAKTEPTKAPEATTAKEASGDNKAADTTAASAEPVTIKIANYALLEKGYDAFWEDVKNGYEAKYPNVTIEWVTAPYGEVLNQVINMAGGGDKVDCVFSEMIWLPALVEAGLAAPMDEVLDPEFLNDYYPNILEAHSIDGKVYGAPLYVSPSLLFYNKDLFEQAGLDPNSPPKTYDEMLTMAEKLSQLKTADGNKVYAFGQPTASVIVIGSAIQAFAANFGGYVFDENGQFNVDNQGFTDALNMLKLLDEKGYNPQNSKPKDLRNLFALGQLAMYYDNSWGFNGVKSINPEAVNFAAAAEPMAGGSGDGTSTLQSHCFVAIDNGPAQIEAVKNFIQYVITPEVLDSYIANIAPALPAKKAMENMDSVKNSPILAGAGNSVEKASPVLMFPALSDFNLELCALAQAVTVGKEDVPAAIESFKSAVQSMIP